MCPKKCFFLPLKARKTVYDNAPLRAKKNLLSEDINYFSFRTQNKFPRDNVHLKTEYLPYINTC